MPTFERKRRDVMMGAGIIAVLVAIGLAIFFLEPFLMSLQHEDHIVAVLPEAPKLATGADVWIAGKKVGTVTRVAFMPFHGDTMARIAATLQFPHSVHYLIRTDSHIRITSARIIGMPVIDISPGSQDKPLIGHGDTIYMPQLVTVITLHAQAAHVAASMDSALTEVKKLSGPARVRMASLAPVMHNLTAAQSSLAAIMEALQNGAAAKFMHGDFMTEVASLQRTAADLGPAFSRASAGMSAPGTDVRTSLKNMQANAERLSAAIDHLQQLMRDNNGTVYRMSADSALLKTLNGAKAQLDSLIMEAKKHPLKFVM